MRAALCIFLLLGCAVLWGWALVFPKPTPPLPERLCREFEKFRFEPPPGVSMGDPFPLGQTWRYIIRSDGSLSVRVQISAGFEMLRREGTVTLIEEDTILMRVLSENGVARTPEDQLFHVRWDADESGEFLLLTGDPAAFQVYLRPHRAQP